MIWILLPLSRKCETQLLLSVLALPFYSCRGSAVLSVLAVDRHDRDELSVLAEVLVSTDLTCLCFCCGRLLFGTLFCTGLFEPALRPSFCRSIPSCSTDSSPCTRRWKSQPRSSSIAIGQNRFFRAVTAVE